MAFIEIKNLFKRFKKEVAVNHIELEVNEYGPGAPEKLSGRMCNNERKYTEQTRKDIK